MYTLKVINVRLFLAQKSGKTAENSRKRGNWAAVPTPNTESEARHRHRLRVRKANNSSLLRLKACSKKDVCPARTNNSSVRGRARWLCAAGCPEAKRTIAEICDFFSAWCNFYQGSVSEQSFAFTPSWWEKRTIIRLTPGRNWLEKRTKKTRAKALAFPNNPPFLCD